MGELLVRRCWWGLANGWSGVGRRGEERLPECPEDKGWQGAGDTVAQYYSYYHFQYVFIYILCLRKRFPLPPTTPTPHPTPTPAPLSHCDESNLLETLLFCSTLKLRAFYKIEFLIRMSCFCAINRLPRLART